MPARDAVAGVKAAKALNLRKLGMTYDAIARECGYRDRGACYHAVQRELQRTLQAPADEVRVLESERLDDLYRVVINLALKGNLQAVDRALRIMERRAALLGLDEKKVTRHELSGADGGPIDVQFFTFNTVAAALTDGSAEDR